VTGRSRAQIAPARLFSRTPARLQTMPSAAMERNCMATLPFPSLPKTITNSSVSLVIFLERYLSAVADRRNPNSNKQTGPPPDSGQKTPFSTRNTAKTGLGRVSGPWICLSAAWKIIFRTPATLTRTAVGGHSSAGSTPSFQAHPVGRVPLRTVGEDHLANDRQRGWIRKAGWLQRRDEKGPFRAAPHHHAVAAREAPARPQGCVAPLAICSRIISCHSDFPTTASGH